MNRAETASVLSVLRAAYPRFYADMSKDELVKIVDLWADMFSADDVRIVGAAVKSLIASDESGFHPDIGQVKAKVRLLTEPQGMTEQDAWGMIAKAVRNSLYGAKEEFDKLPSVLQRMVGSPSQLRDWAMIDADELHTVVASNVMRSFRTVQKREKEIAALPQDVRLMIGDMTQRMALEGKT